jgi:primosomal protein N' (replication factor Y)
MGTVDRKHSVEGNPLVDRGSGRLADDSPGLWPDPPSAPRSPRRRVSVLLPYPFPEPFDYHVPPDLVVQPGDVVLVPLNRREEIGVVWDPPAGSPTEPTPGTTSSRSGPGGTGAGVPEHKLKPLIAVLDTPPMRAELRRFVDWIASYTLSPPGEVMAMALRVVSPDTGRAPAGWRPADPPPQARLTTARQRVLDTLANGVPHSAAELAQAAGVSSGVVRAMAQAGLLVPAALPSSPPFEPPDPEHPGPALSTAQSDAAATLRAAVAAHEFSVTLLDGVTGSGKTEVYFEAVAQCLRAGRQALVLLPEIALSSQWLERFERRFGVAPAVWHSDLSSRTRRITWRTVAAGGAPVVVGARSALFLPFPDLGLVVVDEEHETAFKQEDGVVYHARDMAVVRARLCSAPAVLVSATPSLETVANVDSGRYGRITLANRHGGATLPAVAAIDLRETPPERGKFLAPPLLAAIDATLARGEQAMLFLNRRGYAPLTLCRHCGHRMACPNCTAWLVEHRVRALLQCHHCGHAIPIPPECPACGAAHSLTPVGPGVERITEEAAARFPDARRLVMASDTMPGPQAAAAAAHAIAAREVDLIIGTQIVAKGWHFPHLTLVGVVDADLGLAGGDLRAAERTVQLLHQVAGRAGRAEAPGEVLLQTFSPDHPVMQALIAGDLDAFMTREAAQRRPGHWPPYGRLAALIVSADHAAVADGLARELGHAAPFGDGITVLGPAPAPLSILRGRHRRRLLLKTRREIAVQPILREWLARVKVPRGARVDVDVDPVSFL